MRHRFLSAGAVLGAASSIVERNDMPTQGSAEQILSSALTNAALAVRLEMVQANRRMFSKQQTDAFLAEAAKRLRWSDIYAKHEEDR